VWRVDLTGCQTPTQLLARSPAQQDRGRKYEEKACGSGQRWGNCLPITIMGKTDLTWGKLIYHQLK